jgi:paraquat-inducible protein A
MLIACHECDLLNSVPDVPAGATARCVRCGAVLYIRKKNSIERTLALAIAGLVLFLQANAYPVLMIRSEGVLLKTTLFQGIKALYAQNMWGVAALVFFTCILIPFIQLAGLMYILLPIRMHLPVWKAPAVFRYLRKLQPWGMMEVFMLGILVSIVKLSDMAVVIPGFSLYAFGALAFVLTAAVSSLDPHLIWEKIGGRYD